MTEASTLKSLLRSKSTEERLRALRLMAKEPERIHIPLLLELLSDKSQIVAARAVRLLADRSCYEAIPDLMERYLWYDEDPVARDPGCTVRCEMVLALGKLAGRRALDVIRRAMRTVQIETVAGGREDTATGLRANAATALANTGCEDGLTDLAILLFDMTPNVPVPPTESIYAKAATRVAAARALGTLGYPGAEALLAAKLCNPGIEAPEVLVECMDALVALDSPRSVEFIAPLLGSKEPYVIAGAATALASTGREEVAELLYEAVATAVRDARESIVLAMATLRNSTTLHYLIRLLQHHDAQVRSAATEALESFPSSAVLEAKKNEASTPT